MTKDEMKRKLKGYKFIAKERKQVEAEIEMLDKFVSIEPRDERKGGKAGVGDPTFAMASRRIALRKKYEKLLKELTERQAEVEAIIEALEPRMRILMRCRYIDGLTWEEVCVQVGYSWQQVHRIHAKALDIILKNAERWD